MDVRIADAREGFGGVYHENVGLCCEKSGTESVLMAAVIQLHTGGIHFGVYERLSFHLSILRLRLYSLLRVTIYLSIGSIFLALLIFRYQLPQ